MRYLNLIFLFFAAFYVSAQKLPNKQNVSVWAPANIRIDGKSDEWDNTFQALNKNNRIFYSVANDEEYFYLVLRATDGYISEKALFGVELTVTLPTEQTVKAKKISVIFPKHDTRHKDNIGLLINSSRRLAKDTTARAQHKIDSLRTKVNQLFVDAYREMIVNNIQGNKEETVSIYNDLGIKIGAKFQSPMQYIYELAIPLKYLGTLVKAGQEFKYNVKFLGQPSISSNGMPAPVPINGNDSKYLNSDLGFMTVTTDFTGKYTLAKAP